ncbi:U-scoloptoxin(19)-Tl1a-like isoform X2 [Leguminivora glycinivorella]|uniref:U-scoloptoxin(19)-Tl1a-like isoform X2 n=1 Tax=Leguminivora glycinivorella TaxID=1035111 RepID=UPI00200D7EF1|nr:U-scoloptoxin(19)-Tl1a-like isoform X2 [Leguminivora glycinivorella]
MVPNLFIWLILSAVYVNYGTGYEATWTTHEELPCLTIGGLCVSSTDCQDANRVPVKGLCPQQQKNGIECCYALPFSETRCQKRGGECVEKQQKCPPNLIFSRATDCGERENCCILVN